MTAKFVIDTNVAISANGRETHVSLKCQLACIEWLENCRNIFITLDENGLIMNEYEKHLNYSGQPGVGDMFFKYLHDNQYVEEKIFRVKITSQNKENTEFAELPPNKVDPSDRKFLATAVKAKATIVNATDSDWAEQKTLLETLQIEIKQLCPEYSYK
jgi:predicted nucleic acid-binding protein